MGAVETHILGADTHHATFDRSRCEASPPTMNQIVRAGLCLFLLQKHWVEPSTCVDFHDSIFIAETIASSYHGIAVPRDHRRCSLFSRADRL